MSNKHIPLRTNELMSGLLCECGHDYVCHTPAPLFGCGECNCKRSRVQVADHGGEVVAALLVACEALEEQGALLQAVQGNRGNHVRSQTLHAWADHFEREQGYTSTITHWLRRVADALGKIEQAKGD